MVQMTLAWAVVGLVLGWGLLAWAGWYDNVLRTRRLVSRQNGLVEEGKEGAAGMTWKVPYRAPEMARYNALDAELTRRAWRAQAAVGREQALAYRRVWIVALAVVAAVAGVLLACRFL